MPIERYTEAMQFLRKWHESDPRFQTQFDGIEAYVAELSGMVGTVTPITAESVQEAEPLPPPTSILLTRNAEGRLVNPATGEPFTIVVDTINGREEVKVLHFAGELDTHPPLPPPLLVDPEPESAVVNVPIASMFRDELRSALEAAATVGDAAQVWNLVTHADAAVLSSILPSSDEFFAALTSGSEADLLGVVKAALTGESPFASLQGVDVPPATSMEPLTIDGLPVVEGSLDLPEGGRIELGKLEDLGSTELVHGVAGEDDGDDEADEPAEPSETPSKPATTSKKKKRGS